MAVNCNEVTDPELIKNPDMMFLAEDVVDFMLDLLNIEKCHSELNPIPFRDHIINAFVPIAKAFCFLDNTMEDDHKDFYCDLQDRNFVNSESYEILAKTLATEYFSEGFDAKYFLIYCVNLRVMHFYFRIAGRCDAVSGLPEKHIYQCLEEYVMSDGRWDAIHTIAKSYEKMLDSKNELTSPDTSLVSDEIKHQDKEQEEVSEDLNSSQIEERSISSGNKESKLRKINIFALTFCGTKTYQNRYILYASKSRSEIGSCSSKESKSFSEDTSPSVSLDENKAIKGLESDNEQTPDTSNVDQGLLINIISQFRKKMDLLWNEKKSGD